MVEKKKDFAEWLDFIREIVEENVPLNKILGIKLESLDMDGARLKIAMKDIMVGNYVQGILHGGIISTLLDVTGSVTAYIGVLKDLIGRPAEEIIGPLGKIITIDLRIDYLRPGKGEFFVAEGSMLRLGKKFCVIRTQLHDDQDKMIAVGTGTYIL